MSKLNSSQFIILSQYNKIMKENENLNFKLLQEAILREKISTIIEIGKMENKKKLKGNKRTQQTSEINSQQITSEIIQNIPESISRLTKDNRNLTKNDQEKHYCSSSWIFLKERREDGPMHIYYRGEHCHRANIVMPMRRKNNSQNKKKEEDL
uniref:WRKY domain-containing protein n=1 Tax=Meloidogyne hapla TaxID=6305 RepID=A0A1I8B5Z0_MELHA